jgi:thiamine-monophosphate kinase
MDHTTEDELLEAIRKVLSGAGPEVLVGPGDDAAVVAPGGGEVLLTTDVLVEGVHFERAGASPREIGAKAIAANVSDIAAMGGSPRTALLGLVLSPSVDAAWTMELFGGIRAACDEYACWLVGGDLSRGEQVVVSVSIIGEVAPGTAVTRAGAKVGDALVVTGRLGASAGGLRLANTPLSEAGGTLATPWGRALLDAHLRPTARVGEGQTLAACAATAMIDISDGLSLDLSRLCRASGVGARVRLDDVPVAPELADLAEHVPIDPMELALAGGEDYELLATLPPTRVREAADRLRGQFGTPLAQIGEVVGSGLVAVDASGREHPLEPRGWDHFGNA